MVATASLTTNTTAPAQTGAGLLNETEAAKLLGLSVKTLQRWRWLKCGVPWVRIARRSVRYDPDDIASYIASGRQNMKGAA